MGAAMSCAIHTMLPRGVGYTTLEIKVAYHRALTAQTGLRVSELIGRSIDGLVMVLLGGAVVLLFVVGVSLAAVGGMYAIEGEYRLTADDATTAITSFSSSFLSSWYSQSTATTRSLAE